MIEEIKKIEDMQKELQKFMDELFKKYGVVNKKVAFAAMIIKKTMDIIATSKYCINNYIISVQIMLLRLLCDNCLTIEAANILSVDKFYDMLIAGDRVSDIMVDDEQNMSDGYLKRKVAEKYQGFDRLYAFACNAVHFSKQALGSSLSKDDNGKVSMNIAVGNKDLKEEIIANNNSTILLCQIILNMLKHLCY